MSADKPDKKDEVNPKWAQQFEKATDALTRAVERMAPAPVLIPSGEVDREQLTTPAEAKVYDRMMEKDFLKLDEKTKKILDTENLYRVVHIYPLYQSSNQAEFIAMFVIEQFVFMNVGEDQPRRQIVTSFNIRAKDFVERYRATVTETVALQNS
jgi:hypothetical protein